MKLGYGNNEEDLERLNILLSFRYEIDVKYHNSFRNSDVGPTGDRDLMHLLLR
jgi:hypothetical protein